MTRSGEGCVLNRAKSTVVDSTGALVEAFGPNVVSTKSWKRLAAGMVVVLAASALPMPSAAARVPAVGGNCELTEERVRLGTWTTIPIPEFPPPPFADARYYAVDESRPSTLYVGSGWSAYKSVDGGCTWEESFTTTTTLPGAEIVSITAPSSARAPARTYILLDTYAGPALAIQESGSDDWRVVVPAVDGDVPIGGRPAKLWVAEANPRILYLSVFTKTLGAPRTHDASVLYRSHDAGVTWQLQSASAGSDEPPLWFTGDTSCLAGPSLCTFVGSLEMAVDPVNTDLLWTANYAGIFRSRDGGASWENVYPADRTVLSEVDAIDVFHEPSSAPRIAVFGRTQIAWSADGGASWELRDPPALYTDSGREQAFPELDSVDSSSPDRFLIARPATSAYGDSNLHMSIGRRWARVTPRSVDCRVGSSPPCLTKVSYSRVARAFFAISSAEEAKLMMFRPRPART
jgi:photosystem II stability/assembly factor-like uncharacterized protein